MSQNWSGRLREEIGERATTLAEQYKLPTYLSSEKGTRLFHPFADGKRHGNFLDASYEAIVANGSWKGRLAKVHSHRDSFPDGHNLTACEVDSSSSSDALLMNCFCYPGAVERILKTLLPAVALSTPEFGVSGNVALVGGSVDSTEIDIRVGHAIFEAKLTEKDFTTTSLTNLRRYAAFDSVFLVDRLPQSEDGVRGYQLVRNVLAAAQHGYSLNLLCDARRPDLLREWWHVQSAIREHELRARCGFLFWQEIAAAAPAPLRSFLSEKYGLNA